MKIPPDKFSNSRFHVGEADISGLLRNAHIVVQRALAPWLAVVFVFSSHAYAAPNFVFILADDLGVRDLGVEGSTYYETPHIDRLARRGMRFTQGYATCQVCSPSRASIMTGKFPARHGITDWIGAAATWDWKRNGRILPAEYNRHLNHEDVTIAEALRAAGYRTFFAGKWHLGTTGSHPEDHGFDINKGGYSSGSPRGGYFAPYKNPELSDGPIGESLPIRLASETKQFIEAHRKQPFLAFLSFYSVHGPIQTNQRLWKKYRDKAQPRTENRFIIDRTLPVRQVQDCPIYAGMMESMDDAVGIVMQCLDDLGLSENTVVIFTSDNGGVSSGDAFATSNLPLRGGKGRQWEGGIREPFYVIAPGVTEPGAVSNTPVTGADFYPTMLELAGLPLNPNQHADGRSMVPLLKGDSLPPRPLFWHYPHYGNQGGEPSSIIRRDAWKLIHYWEDDRNELYDLATDPHEAIDVSTKHRARVGKMHDELIGYLAQVGARIPARDPRFDEQRAERQAKEMREKRLPALEAQHANFLDPSFVPNQTWWDSQGVRD